MTTDALICLDCGYVHFIKDGKTNVYTLTDRGKQQIKSLYGRLFPGHSADVEDADSKLAKDTRCKEWDRRYQAGHSTFNPATLP